MIFTYVWALDQEDDKLQLDNYCEIFKKQGGSVFFVELEADLEERLERNKGEFRLQKKSSKRDIARSESNLLNTEKNYKMNSKDDFFYKENYVKINNTNISPEETARQIADTFDFTVTQSE